MARSSCPGSIFVPGTETYNEFVDFMGEVMTNYSSEVSLGMWDIMNEPNGDAAYSDYWSQLPNPDASWITWDQAITAAAVTKDHHHLITMGTASGIFQGFEEAPFDEMNDNSCDVAQSHNYGSETDTHLITDLNNWSIAVDKPCLLGEAGYADAGPPWGIYYWPWMDTLTSSLNVSIIWMTLWGMPGYPATNANISAIPNVPIGYHYPNPGSPGGGSGGSGEGNATPASASIWTYQNIAMFGIVGAGLYFGMAAVRKKW